MKVTYNEPYGNPGLSLPIPTRTNYDFIGWFTQANGGVQVIDSTIVTNPNEHTLYAHWSESTLCFDADVVMRNGCWSATSYENGVYIPNEDVRKYFIDDTVDPTWLRYTGFWYTENSNTFTSGVDNIVIAHFPGPNLCENKHAIYKISMDVLLKRDDRVG